MKVNESGRLLKVTSWMGCSENSEETHRNNEQKLQHNLSSIEPTHNTSLYGMQSQSCEAPPVSNAWGFHIFWLFR